MVNRDIGTDDGNGNNSAIDFGIIIFVIIITKTTHFTNAFTE